MLKHIQPDIQNKMASTNTDKTNTDKTNDEQIDLQDYIEEDPKVVTRVEVILKSHGRLSIHISAANACEN